MTKKFIENPNQLSLDLFKDTQTNEPIIRDAWINVEELAAEQLNADDAWEFNEDWGEWFNNISGETMSVAAWETADNNHF